MLVVRGSGALRCTAERDFSRTGAMTKPDRRHVIDAQHAPPRPVEPAPATCDAPGSPSHARRRSCAAARRAGALQRAGARPATAVQIPGQTPIRSTVYIADQLLVRNADPGAAGFDALTGRGRGARAASRGRCARHASVHRPAPARERSRTTRRRSAGSGWSRNRRRPDAADRRLAGAADVPDACWPSGELPARRRARPPADRDAVLLRVALLVRARPTPTGSPYCLRFAVLPTGPASCSTACPGSGGRQPVAWIGAEPPRRPSWPAAPPPVVAVLDTGAGAHPWLPKLDRATAIATVTDVPSACAGVASELRARPGPTLGNPLLGELGHRRRARHVHRRPDPPALPGRQHPGRADHGQRRHGDRDRPAPRAARCCCVRQTAAQTRRPAANAHRRRVAVASATTTSSPRTRPSITCCWPRCGRWPARGVAVVAAAGNDSTYRCMYPAAFTPWPGGLVTEPRTTPGAADQRRRPEPRRQTIALFSNAGEWVACHRRGAALVSTFPTTSTRRRAGLRAVVVVPVTACARPSTPTTSAAASASWSGTSFAAPILAGQLAQRCWQDGPLPTDHGRLRRPGLGGGHRPACPS